MARPLSAVVFFALILLLAVPGVQAETRDGKLFDPGTQMTEPSEKAPKDIAKMADFLGDWDVTLERFPEGKDAVRSAGKARVTFMNRGHNIMERARFADFDGQGTALATMSFLSVDIAGNWAYGEANSFTQAVTLASGDFEGKNLVLHDARRPGGALTLLLIRRTLAPAKNGGFTLTSEASKDFGETWRTTETRTYMARETQDGFFPVRDDTGLPAPGRSPEATQFDFLLGEFKSHNWLLLGQQALRWPDHSTAVYALDGHAVMEFGWNDFDPSLPDAATTILRIYNEAQRRWETLYLPNRGNAPLHFGGVQEGDQIVLHTFGAINDGSQMPQWIFYDVQPDAYRWKALVSNNRGEDYGLGWAIDFQRKGVEVPDAKTAPPAAVHTTSADGTTVYGDHYRPAWSGSPTVVLFHQAGGDARGEYTDIARRLVAEGYEVFAWDARAGGERFGQTNRTAAALAAETQPGYCDAYPDLEAALQFSVHHGGGGPVYAVGSSYSAALVVRLAAEHGKHLDGVAAFSPASSPRMEDCAVDNWLPEVEGVPVLAFRPASETDNESTKAQTQMFQAKDIEVFVAEDGVHGASMLNPDKVDGDVEGTWTRFLAFLADPAGAKSE